MRDIRDEGLGIRDWGLGLEIKDYEDEKTHIGSIGASGKCGFVGTKQ